MKTKSLFFLVITTILLSGCSLQYKLRRNYVGESISAVSAQMGNPKHTEPQSDGTTLNIFEKNTILKAAPINTGQFQYDRFESPKSIKTEVFMFYADSNGIVKDVKYECKYER